MCTNVTKSLKFVAYDIRNVILCVTNVTWASFGNAFKTRNIRSLNMNQPGQNFNLFRYAEK